MIVVHKSGQDRVAELFRAGLSDEDIIRLTGLKKSTVERYRSDQGLTRPTVLGFKPKGSTMEREPPAPREPPNPITVAVVWLGRRLVEKPSGYWLDGQPVNLKDFMRETNRLLVAAGAEQLGPELWRV